MELIAYIASVIALIAFVALIFAGLSDGYRVYSPRIVKALKGKYESLRKARG